MKVVLLLGLILAVSGCRLMLREDEALEMTPYYLEAAAAPSEDKAAIRPGEKPEMRPDFIPRTMPVGP